MEKLVGAYADRQRGTIRTLRGERTQPGVTLPMEGPLTVNHTLARRSPTLVHNVKVHTLSFNNRHNEEENAFHYFGLY